MADVDRRSEAKFILPFAVSAEDRIKAFTKDMEMAVILCLAELDREKGEGHVFKKPHETLVFIAETCYPIWLVPWNRGTLLFDGLGVTAHTLPYDSLPDIKAFNDDIRARAETREAYSVALSRNADYFRNFGATEEKAIEGLIASPDFIRDFLTYLSEAEEAEEPFDTKTVLSPIVTESELSSSIEELSDLKEKIDRDANNLETSMKLLSKTTREEVRAIREEIKKVRKEFDKQIEKVKPRVTRKTRQTQKRYNERLTKISKRFERQLRLLHQNQVKLEKTQRRLSAEISRCEAKIKSSKRLKRKGSETQWTQKLKKAKKKLSTVKKQGKDTNRKIVKTQTAQDLETSQLKIECETRIEEATKILRDLKASREARIRMKQKTITSIKDMTSSIINQMNEMATSKKAALNELERTGVPRREKAPVLAYLPFYLVRYEMDAKKRYVVHPPSIAGGMRFSTKMKGVLGGTRMRAFLQPRSEAITAFLNQLASLIQNDPVFEKEVTKAGIQDGILGTKQLRKGVKKGLKELKEERWISKNELQTIGQLLYVYA